jgi:hypothetical protein
LDVYEERLVWRTKKDASNVFCSRREASDANYFLLGGDSKDCLYQRNKYSIA